MIEAIDRFNQLHVLCVGDLMLDRFVYGDAGRISPEAPIPVVHQTSTLETLGGVGNAARNLNDLGAAVTMIGVVGVDIAGSDIAALMVESGMDTSGIIVDPVRRTTLKTRIVARTQQMLRLDDEDTSPLSPEIEHRICAQIREYAAQADAIILSDYGKGMLTHRVVATAIEAAKVQTIPILVDPKGSDYSLYRGATLVTPNVSELVAATGGLPLNHTDMIVEAALTLLETNDLAAVVVTRSKDGMSVVEAGGATTHLSTQAREVFDVSGAGDTVIATLALGMAAGLSLPDAAQIANAAAGVVVGKLGTATLTQHELITALHEANGGHNGKILDWAHASVLAASWRAQGLSVATTNGCFDILHEGHVTLLEAARASADRLIVLINADDSVRRLKGEGRPVNTAMARARVLSALSAVDAVVVFGAHGDEKDMPLQALTALKPDIHIKGGDYRAEDLPETPVVKGWGGKILIIPFVAGFSTTSTIEKLRG